MRHTDTTAKEHFRSPYRIFRREGQWYFQTRQGDRGPYASQEAAQLRLDRYVETMGFVAKHKPWVSSDVDLSDVTVVELAEPDRYSG